MSAAAALVVATALAGCGTTTYFAGRTLPPSGLKNRVLIAVQNPSAFTRGALEFVDAYYDIRSSFNGSVGGFSISGYAGALPITIQNMPEEQYGAVYGSGDGSLTLINYAKESTAGTAITTMASSIYTTRNQTYVFAASQTAHVLTIGDKSATNGGTYSFSLPGIYRVSVNTGGSIALAFVQNSNNVYYPVKLSAAQTLAYSGGTATWPKAAVDCEPQNLPGWCLFQAQSPDTPDPMNAKNPSLPPLYYGAPLTFDRPTKAVFSADGGTAYVLNCGPECGGNIASITPLPVAPMIYLPGQQSGSLPVTALNTLVKNTLSIPGGASNALVDSSTMYVVGQCLADNALTSANLPQCPLNTATQSSLFTGMLTVVTLPSGSSSTMTAAAPVSISDGAPGATSRMLLADDNTLWIGMTKCINGTRANKSLAYGCLTMYNTSTNTPKMLPYLGDLTGVAGVTTLHKIYVAQGGQVYIYSTVDGTSIDNQYVTVTGTAYDVAYMDGLTDGNNTVY